MTAFATARPSIAFIGAGRMATAMIEGLIAAGTASATIAVTSARGDSAAALATRLGIVAVPPTAANPTAGADIIVIAYKPQHLAATTPTLRDATAGRLVVSVLAAKTLAHLAATFPAARNHVRAMPNTPASIRAGVTGWCAASPLAPADRTAVENLFTAIGHHHEIPETKMEALMGVSGCGPAFVFEFTAALRDAGIAAGLDSAESAQLALQTVLGSARLMARSETTPEALRDQVTSPNGTTYAGLQHLAAGNFRQLLRDTVAASITRAHELSR